jgi:hypothetical protein
MSTSVMMIWLALASDGGGGLSVGGRVGRTDGADGRKRRDALDDDDDDGDAVLVSSLSDTDQQNHICKNSM